MSEMEQTNKNEKEKNEKKQKVHQSLVTLIQGQKVLHTSSIHLPITYFTPHHISLNPYNHISSQLHISLTNTHHIQMNEMEKKKKHSSLSFSRHEWSSKPYRHKKQREKKGKETNNNDNNSHYIEVDFIQKNKWVKTDHQKKPRTRIQ